MFCVVYNFRAPAGREGARVGISGVIGLLQDHTALDIPGGIQFHPVIPEQDIENALISKIQIVPTIEHEIEGRFKYVL